ncbi:hypothetical protein TRVL_01831 [Trypanosoma vivax]|nr:hypothetical protein TRVL_01831 [Trypanosoma vivax]
MWRTWLVRASVALCLLAAELCDAGAWDTALEFEPLCTLSSQALGTQKAADSWASKAGEISGALGDLPEENALKADAAAQACGKSCEGTAEDQVFTKMLKARAQSPKLHEETPRALTRLAASVTVAARLAREAMDLVNGAQGVKALAAQAIGENETDRNSLNEGRAEDIRAVSGAAKEIASVAWYVAAEAAKLTKKGALDTSVWQNLATAVHMAKEELRQSASAQEVWPTSSERTGSGRSGVMDGDDVWQGQSGGHTRNGPIQARGEDIGNGLAQAEALLSIAVTAEFVSEKAEAAGRRAQNIANVIGAAILLFVAHADKHDNNKYCIGGANNKDSGTKITWCTDATTTT